MRWAEVSAALSAPAHAGGVPMRCTSLHGLCFLRPVERDRFVHVRLGQTLTTLVSIQAEEPTTGQYLWSVNSITVNEIQTPDFE